MYEGIPFGVHPLEEATRDTQNWNSHRHDSTTFAPENIQLGHIDCNGVNVVLGPMTVADYTAVRQLLPSVSRGQMIHTPEEVARLLSVPTYHPFCAYRLDTGALVGFAELHRLPHLSRKFDGRLERLVVSPNFRNQGLATKFVSHVLNQSKAVLNCGRVDLTAENPAAVSIYRALGFAGRFICLE